MEGRFVCFELGKGPTSVAGSLSSDLLMCGGGVRSILLLSFVTRCLETIDVCIWRMFVFMSVVGTVWGSVGMFVFMSLFVVVVRLSVHVHFNLGLSPRDS